MKAFVLLGLATAAGYFLAGSLRLPQASAQANAGLPASPAANGLPASPSAPGLPIQPSRSAFPSQAGTGAGTAMPTAPARYAPELGTVLANTQAQLEQALAVLYQVTTNVSGPGVTGSSVTTLGPTIGSAQPTATTTTATSGQNLSASAGVNLSTRTTANLSANASVPAGAAPPAAMPGSAAQNLNIVTGPGAAGAQPAPVLMLSQDTLQALQVLQTEVERVLPLVAAVNRGAGYSALANNGLVAPAGVHTQLPPTPTGRVGPAPPGNLRTVPQ